MCVYFEILKGKLIPTEIITAIKKSQKIVFMGTSVSSSSWINQEKYLQELQETKK